MIHIICIASAYFFTGCMFASMLWRISDERPSWSETAYIIVGWPELVFFR